MDLSFLSKIREWSSLLADRKVVLGFAVAATALLLVVRGMAVEPQDEGGEAPPEEPDLEVARVEEPAEGGSLRVAMPEKLSTLDPHRATTPSERMVVSALTDPLFSFDMSGGVGRGVLKDWDVDNAATVYTLNLRPDVYFTDGTRLDAEAVKYNLKRMQEVGSPVMVGAWLASIREVQVTDDLQLRIDLWHPDPQLPFNLSRAETGLVSPQTAFETEDGKQEELTLAPVGLGPFAVDDPQIEHAFLREQEEEAEPPDDLSELTLSYFSEYWRGRPRLDSLTFVYAEADDPERLLGRGIDVVTEVPPGYSIGEDLGTNLVRPNLDHHIMSLNLASDGLQERAVRRALHHAIDRESIIDRIYSGDADELFIGGHPADPGGHVEEEPDLERAEHLLRTSGYGEDDDPLTLNMLSNADEERVAVSREIADQLGRFGIELDVEILPDEEYYKRMRAGEYDISYWVLIPQLADPMGYTANLRSDAHWNVSQIWREDDLRTVKSRIDDLLTDASRTTEERDRLEYYREFAELAAREQLYVSLWITGTRAVVADHVREVDVSYGFSFCFWETWLALDE